MLNTEVFLNFLLSVRQITRAETVSLLINNNERFQSEVLLLHEGHNEPLLEFSTKKNALISTKKLVESLNNDESSKFVPIRLWKSVNQKGYLLNINLAVYFQGLAETKNLPEQIDRRANGLSTLSFSPLGELWVGLNFAESPVPKFIEVIMAESDLRQIAPPETTADWFVQLLCQGGGMVWQAFKFANLFKDPISRLPGRIEFQVCLKTIMFEKTHEKATVGLILINPDEFSAINQRLGRDKGDLALAEIADRLLSVLRRNDLVFRYGGAMFALILPSINKQKINVLIEKIRIGLSGSYLDNSAQLTFSVGATIHQSKSGKEIRTKVIKLIKQADQALNVAKLSGGSKSVIWDKAKIDSSILSMDRLGNIFTSESEKDYRNMLLLWDTIAVISTGSDAKNIAVEFVERVKLTLRPFRIGLFEERQDSTLEPLATSYGQESGQIIQGSEWQISKSQKKLLEAVKQGKRTERIKFSASNTAARQQNTVFVAYGFPLLVRDQLNGYLYIDGPETVFSLDSSDLAFLNTLTHQLALALDRASLELRLKKEKEKESRLLKQEVRELRQAIHSTKLIYYSSQMQSLLETLSSVAPTDVTILITGESGTGKEMLAREVHEQSLRKDKPIITVDCGAIAVSLIETELFGHVKGAYTGAQSASLGRILQAEGGTLFLDEIGELPLDVQAKLLRFVQEKEITPVGGGQTKKVDVRIVAATNRNLAEEVAAGRFRGDLYYRLQVITLLSPPLRDRVDDIIPLARHFLEKFSNQYQKGMLYFKDEAEKALLIYQWPGNIRELQNTIMRAVVISKTDSIDLALLNLKIFDLSKPVNTFQTQVQPTEVDLIQSSTSVGGDIIMENQATEQSNNEQEVNIDMWEQLRNSLIAKIQSILQADKVVSVPLGRWLSEDLMLEVEGFENNVIRRASKRLGLPETTLRRQVEKLNQAKLAGVLSRTADWKTIQPFLAKFVSSLDQNAPQNIIEQVRLILLKEIIRLVPNDKTLGSALMGVTLPTYQRWLEKIPD